MQKLFLNNNYNDNYKTLTLKLLRSQGKNTSKDNVWQQSVQGMGFIRSTTRDLVHNLAFEDNSTNMQQLVMAISQ